METTVVIDDQNPAIRYVGSWEKRDVNKDGSETIHGTYKAGDQAIFTFKGSSISVFGTRIPGPTSATTSFSVDDSGATMQTDTAPKSGLPISRQLFYISQKLDPSKEHTIVITLIHSPGGAFWLDYFQVVQVEATTSPSNAAGAPQPSSKQSSPQASQPASQLNDDPSRSSVSVPLSSTQLPSASVPTTSTNMSTTSSTPILAQSLQSSTHSNSEFVSSDTALLPTMTSTTQAQTPAQNPSELSKGAIVGIAVGSTVGGLSLLALIAVILFWMYRRRTSRKESPQSSPRTTAFPSFTTSDYTTYDPGAGYIVRGGNSKEKAGNYLALQGEGRRPGSGHSDGLPAYESEFGDTLFPRSPISQPSV